MTFSSSLETLLFLILLGSLCLTSAYDIFKNISLEASKLSQNIINEFCVKSRVGGSKCDSVSDSYKYGFQDYIDSLVSHFSFTITHAKDVTDNIYQTINNEINKQKLMIQNIETQIQQICMHESDENDVNNEYFMGGAIRNATFPPNYIFSDVFERWVSYNSSGYVIPDDVNFTENILSEIIFVSKLESVFRDNVNNICGINNFCIQYFGSVSGLFTMYPYQEIGGNYDPRLRNWYVRASSTTKNVVILIDNSITMAQSNKLELVKKSVISFINTLGYNTYINILSFNDDNIKECSGVNASLVQLNSDIVNKLINFVDNITITNSGQDLRSGFNRAFDLLDSQNVSCKNSILLFTDNMLVSPENVINSRILESETRIFVYEIGDESDVMNHNLSKLATENNGLYSKISNDNLNIQTQLSHFHLLSNYGLNKDIITTSEPYLDFSTKELMITPAKSVSINNEFVGVIGTDMPISIIEDFIGDFNIGYKSYYFLINNKGTTLIHPDLVLDNVDNIIIPDISLLEPQEFTTLGIRDDMILGKRNYTKITAHVKQLAGDVSTNGYLLVEQELLYIYYPLADGELSIAFVIFTESDIKEPLVPSFGLVSVPTSKCPKDEDVNYDELYRYTNCIYSPAISDRVNNTRYCNSSWLDDMEIEPTRNAAFYGNNKLVLSHSLWSVLSTLYSDEESALNGVVSCDELNEEYKYTNNELYNSSNLPFGGFKLDSTKYSASISGIFYKFMKDAFNVTNTTLNLVYFSSYESLFYSYPGIETPRFFVPIVRPWYQLALSYPDKFTVTTPYKSFGSDAIIMTGATVITAPQSSNPYGVFAYDYDLDVIKFFGQNLLSCINATSECYVIDSSGLVVYYDDMETYNGSISEIFLGQYDMEPTLAESLINIGFLSGAKWVNYEDYRIDFSYTVNNTVYRNEKLYETPNNFSLNTGYYTIHEIEQTNLYLVYIQNYNKISEYPNNCPNNELCPNVVFPGCIKDSDGNCSVPESGYSSTTRDECINIEARKLYTEMKSDNNVNSISMCGWKGGTVNPTTSPTRYPTGKDDYDGYYTVSLEFSDLGDKLHKQLDKIETSVLDNVIELQYFNEISTGGYYSFDVVITSINNRELTSNNHKKKLVHNKNSVTYEIWSSFNYYIVVMSEIHNSKIYNNQTFEYKLIRSVITTLDPTLNTTNLEHIINTTNITESEWIDAHSNDPNMVTKTLINIYNDKLFFINVLIIIVSLIVDLYAYFHMKCRCQFPHRQVDSISTKSLCLYSLQVWDLFSDIGFINFLYHKWANNDKFHENSLLIYQFLLFASIIFVSVPWITNMWPLIFKAHHIKHKFENNPYSIKWFRLHNKKLALLTAACGSLYPALTFGMFRNALNMGLSKTELSLFLENKVKLNTLLENIPQVILQIIFLSYEGEGNINTIIAMTSSVISIITTVLQYKFSKLNKHSYTKRYEIRLLFKNNKQLFEMYETEEYRNFVLFSNCMCKCLVHKSLQQKTDVMECICCIKCCKCCICTNERNNSLKVIKSDEIRIKERKLLYKHLLNLLTKYTNNISIHDIEILSITANSNYLLILIDYFNIKLSKDINTLFSSEKQNISKAIHELFLFKHNYPICIQQNTKHWEIRKKLFFEEFKQKEPNINFIQLNEDNKNFNDSMNNNQIYICKKTKFIKFNNNNSNNNNTTTGLYNRSRELSLYRKKTGKKHIESTIKPFSSISMDEIVMEIIIQEDN